MKKQMLFLVVIILVLCACKSAPKLTTLPEPQPKACMPGVAQVLTCVCAPNGKRWNCENGEPNDHE